MNGEGSQLTGGPLNSDTFMLEQFHAHWGCSNERGSEHTVSNCYFKMIVYLNRPLFFMRAVKREFKHKIF